MEAEIKEKVKKNPGYLHPCNKERQEDMKMLKFANGYDFTCWMQQNGIMANPTDIKRKEMKKTIEKAECKTIAEYLDKCAKNAGFKSNARRHKDYKREWRHKTGRGLPKEFNEDCTLWFGEFISQNYVMKTFEDPIKMPPNNPGFDWICKKGEKIDHKGACLVYSPGRSSSWTFHIEYNDIADWFILSAWDSRDSLNPLHVWVFHKNDMVRYRIGGGYILKRFCDRDSISIPNTPEALKEFEKYEVTNRLDKLKDICNKDKHNKKRKKEGDKGGL